MAGKIDERLGPAAQTLDVLLAAPGEAGSFDFAFIDADKKGYRGYYEQLLQVGGGRVRVHVCLCGAGAPTCPHGPSTVPIPSLPPSHLQLVRPGGVIAVDNVLWYGRVADPEQQDSNTAAIRELNDFLISDERVTLSIIPVGDGIALCTKR